MVIAGAVTVVPPDGAKTATESASWLLLAAVQLEEAAPVALIGLVEPAPPELDWPMAQREVWPLPAVKVALPEPLFTASTNHEPAVATVTLAEIAVPEVAVLIAAALGALCATPLSETEPALTPLTAPPKVMDTVWAPAAGLSR